ncbi:class I SAM-dependent methyltransferase [Algoriphagus aestuariicola]|uniref:Class I SAM-dependent methyltransferase n=1 Tax=Algoriphagus aestuariicola TaxID=1852016 RepID=A0ABS3BXB9_9BACT|nr:class I SAM-dependent methyltransferase [Algoriphagus aestuariicola]MBN7802364.1 class I SAM-dependent methyltransferase [Algoriphagus aestuariicola]
MLERLSKCPLCKSGLFLNYTEIIDHAVTKEIFVLCKCSNCQLLFTNPRPVQEKIGPYYDFPEYYSHEDKAKNITQWIYQKVRNYSITKKITSIEKMIPTGSLLDYGCGTGELLVAAKQRGWKIAGVEPNDKARKQASQKLNKKVKASIDELKKNSSFDVITLYHVLEHIHQLRKTVKKIVSHLKSDGYLLIAVPNHQSWDGKKYGQYWAGWDVPRHLYHFGQDSMKKFEEEFGVELKETQPMKFDSFYVSLLSEGYMVKSSTLISKYSKAIRAGLNSNRAAKTPGQFSSNIFVFQKK